jgi:UDP-2,3-diacylglucosamine hydrolase
MAVAASDLFISDLHLDAPAGVRMLVDALEAQPAPPRRLYILGDLFEVWIGDDDDAELPEAVASVLNEQQLRGSEVYFLAGNRDFLLGQKYLDRCGAMLIPDPCTIDCYGHAVTLIHGDRECLADVEYQQFRRQVRTPEWRQAFLTQSLKARREFAAQARARSRDHTQGAAAYLLDADAAALQALIEAEQASVLIHGHTHRPAIHALHTAHGPGLRVVLGAWHHHPSLLHASAEGLCLQAEGLEVRTAWPPCRQSG